MTQKRFIPCCLLPVPAFNGVNSEQKYSYIPYPYPIHFSLISPHLPDGDPLSLSGSSSPFPVLMGVLRSELSFEDGRASLSGQWTLDIINSSGWWNNNMIQLHFSYGLVSFQDVVIGMHIDTGDGGILRDLPCRLVIQWFILSIKHKLIIPGSIIISCSAPVEASPTLTRPSPPTWRIIRPCSGGCLGSSQAPRRNPELSRRQLSGLSGLLDQKSRMFL